MKQDNIAFVIVTLWFNELVTSQDSPNIVELLDRKEAIWTYMTTSTHRRYDCKADVIDDINHDYVLFRSFFGYRSVIKSDWQQFLEGRLWYSEARNNPRNHAYNAMNVSYRGATPYTTEVLTYLSPNKECGVVSVIDLTTADISVSNTLQQRNMDPLVHC
ncbi:uncharacterized protein LOC119375542 isoform X2 [Rhipicephalus sanguineus]|uniref:uncharacterized protein LOC119375542 isoform X2 n=1 Tax=Rhipicephalus sanguineus TaxID=34632 RepID=UPI0018953C9E|nr:uncharacterized protein LOC119375542 isoform X2 [Rhipicephalus sanguineus]